MTGQSWEGVFIRRPALILSAAALFLFAACGGEASLEFRRIFLDPTACNDCAAVDWRSPRLGREVLFTRSNPDFRLHARDLESSFLWSSPALDSSADQEWNLSVRLTREIQARLRKEVSALEPRPDLGWYFLVSLEDRPVAVVSAAEFDYLVSLTGFDTKDRAEAIAARLGLAPRAVSPVTEQGASEAEQRFLDERPELRERLREADERLRSLD